MLAKTSAIILSTVKYGDNSIILKTYTREEGLMSFIAGGLRSKKGAVRPAMTQVLSILDLVYYQKSKGDLKRLKEASVNEPLREIFYDPVKSSLAMFLAEILQHVLHEDEPDAQLYEFLNKSVKELDERKEGFGSFHLLFLYRLSPYLGFRPERPHDEGYYFDLMNGVFTASEPIHPHYLGKNETTLWRELHTASQGIDKKWNLNRPRREILLRALIEYYRLHIKDFGQLRSLQILKELLS